MLEKSSYWIILNNINAIISILHSKYIYLRIYFNKKLCHLVIHIHKWGVQSYIVIL